jgi:hypothetical protein
VLRQTWGSDEYCTGSNPRAADQPNNVSLWETPRNANAFSQPPFYEHSARSADRYAGKAAVGVLVVVLVLRELAKFDEPELGRNLRDACYLAKLLG